MISTVIKYISLARITREDARCYFLAASPNTKSHAVLINGIEDAAITPVHLDAVREALLVHLVDAANLLGTLTDLVEAMPAPRSRKVTEKWDAARAAIAKAKTETSTEGTLS